MMEPRILHHPLALKDSGASTALAPPTILEINALPLHSVISLPTPVRSSLNAVLEFVVTLINLETPALTTLTANPDFSATPTLHYAMVSHWVLLAIILMDLGVDMEWLVYLNKMVILSAKMKLLSEIVAKIFPALHGLFATPIILVKLIILYLLEDNVIPIWNVFPDTIVLE
jgi:hypothetical protein